MSGKCLISVLWSDKVTVNHVRIVFAVNTHVLLYQKKSDIDWKLNHLNFFLASNNDLFRELHHMYRCSVCTSTKFFVLIMK